MIGRGRRQGMREKRRSKRGKKREEEREDEGGRIINQTCIYLCTIAW